MQRGPPSNDKHQRGLALCWATAQFFAAETVERAWFYEMLADERRDFKLTFGMEQSQTFAMRDIPTRRRRRRRRSSRRCGSPIL